MNNEEYIELINMYINKDIDKETFYDKLVEITNSLKTPLKEFYIINAYLYRYCNVPSNLKEFLYDYSLPILSSTDITESSKNKIKCALMNAYTSDYSYEMAEKYAIELLNANISDIIILRDLANYYTKTRRYKLAESLYNIVINAGGRELATRDYQKFINVVNKKQKDYLPADYENKVKYLKFLTSLNIQFDDVIHKKQPEKIKVDNYPIPVEHTMFDFDSFVAFDVETTGIDTTRDSITEIAAIKVLNGQIIEEKEFLFQELVHPYKRTIPPSVEKLTGITNEMVKDAPRIWEVFPKFVDFIGDSIMLGYNCMSFDSKFLVRAGRLSNIIIENEYFDVLHMAKQYKSQLSCDNMKLVSVGETLGIKNPQAHRALADAITTAKVYLALKKLKPVSPVNDIVDLKDEGNDILN